MYLGCNTGGMLARHRVYKVGHDALSINVALIGGLTTAPIRLRTVIFQSNCYCEKNVHRDLLELVIHLILTELGLKLHSTLLKRHKDISYICIIFNYNCFPWNIMVISRFYKIIRSYVHNNSTIYTMYIVPTYSTLGTCRINAPLHLLTTIC